MSAENQPINLLDYEQLARDRLPKAVYDYYAGGADDGITLRENGAAYDRIRLNPHILADVGQRSSQVTLLGQDLCAPILIAPMALAGMAHPDAELAIARAAEGIPFALSTLSSRSIEEVAAVARSPLWFQLYVYRDRTITEKLVQRAEAAGYKSLVVTVDVQVTGNRERDRRNQFKVPEGVSLKNLVDFALDQVADQAEDSSIAAYATAQIDPTLTWRDIDWLRSITTLPIVLKGVLRADDARQACDHGVAALIVSNHGGRQLDSVPAAIDALPQIAAAVGNQMPLILDGGVRRGTDILKALALGARAAMVGRPILWGLAVGGEAGVRHVLNILRTEFDTALALCGCASVADIQPDLIWKP